MPTPKKTQPAAPKRTRAKKKRKKPRLTAAQRLTLTEQQLFLLDQEDIRKEKLEDKMAKAQENSGPRRSAKRAKPVTLDKDGKPKKWGIRCKTNEGITYK